MGKISFRKIIGKVHLIAGLLSGSIVFFVALTGCILVFEAEISRALDYGIYKEVKSGSTAMSPPSKIFRVADSILADIPIKRSDYTAHLQGAQVTVLWALDKSGQYHATLHHPQTGDIIAEYDYPSSFFAIMLDLHMTLGIGEFGKKINGYATLLFVLLLFSGIVLWRPANKKGYKQRFSIKWNASGKRLNYDLHNVLGFYMSWIGIFIATTGLVWSYEWVSNSIQWIANGGKSIAYQEHNYHSNPRILADQESLVERSNFVVDSIFFAYTKATEDVKSIKVYKPGKPEDPLYIALETIRGGHYMRTDYYIHDRYSGKLLGTEKFSQLSRGEQVRRINYPIHVGAIGGLTGKIVVFFASLIVASLPITGLLIWWGRNKRNRLKSII